jgi:citrate lyase subunit beta/citryl-CoA lyase
LIHVLQQDSGRTEADVGAVLRFADRNLAENDVILRSLLFVPGNKANMLEKALTVSPDALVPDMEDSVPAAEKANARETIHSFLPRLAAARRPVIARVNALETGWIEADLEAVVGPHVFGVSVGKVRSAGDIAAISQLIAAHERRAGLDVGTVHLLPWIETAEAIVNAFEICRASSRIVGVAFGGEDFANDLGIERLEDESQIAYARQSLCIAARAAHVLALDTPYFKLRNPGGLRDNALRAKSIGFKGKFAIHPEQIDALNECFSPSSEEIAHAERVVAAFEEAESRGRGSTSLDGWVIDVPVVKRARALLDLARRASAER